MITDGAYPVFIRQINYSKDTLSFLIINDEHWMYHDGFV